MPEPAPLSDADLDRLRALCDAATPGPWYTVDLPWRAPGCRTYVVAGNPDPHVGRPVLDGVEIDEWPAEDEGPDYSQSDADLEFAAAARNALPRLLAELRAARAELARRAERPG